MTPVNILILEVELEFNFKRKYEILLRIKKVYGLACPDAEHNLFGTGC